MTGGSGSDKETLERPRLKRTLRRRLTTGATDTQALVKQAQPGTPATN